MLSFHRWAVRLPWQECEHLGSRAARLSCSSTACKLPGQLGRQEAGSHMATSLSKLGSPGEHFVSEINRGKLTRGEQEHEFSACCWLCFVLHEDSFVYRQIILSLQVMGFHFGACPQMQDSEWTVQPQPCLLCSNLSLWRSPTPFLLLYMMGKINHTYNRA